MNNVRIFLENAGFKCFLTFLKVANCLDFRADRSLQRMGFSKRDISSSCSDDSGGDFFKNIKNGCSAFFIWKIEGLQVISVSKTNFGIFLSDSAYLIYTASSKDGPSPYPGMTTKEMKNNLAVRAIHFWVGSECESAISGAAALRAAELDSQINATILQREAQGRESPRFLSYFQQRIIVQNFHLQTPNILIHRVTGVGIPISTELKEVAWDQFSSRDVIFIDVCAKSVIFLWIGSSADPLHKIHAAKLLEARKENNIVRIFVVEDGFEQRMNHEARLLFDKILDSSKRTLALQPHEQSYLPSPIKLYRCSKQIGKYKIAELKSGPISRSDFESDSVFLVDRGEVGVWAWVGKAVNSRERLEAVRNARGFVKKKGYSADVLISRASEGHEPTELKSMIRGCGEAKPRPFTLPVSFDVGYMNERPKLAAECQLVDDGSGEKILWRVSREQGVIQVDDQGIFFASACYVLSYKYGHGRKTRMIVYCWEGVHSSHVDREVALEAACSKAKEDSAQLVIASQGREPAQLLQIYNGKLTILAGPHKNSPPKKYLVRVYGSSPYTSKAVERPIRASSLDSKGVFVLFSNSSFVWCGSRSMGDAREASRKLVPSSVPLVVEGKEDDEFWSELGGKSAYGTEIEDQEEDMEKHLYRCRVESKNFIGEEILGFTQNSLLPEAAWLLDTGNTVWIWIGRYSNIRSLQDYVEDAKTFLYTHPASRDRNTIISVITQGYEPSTFIGLFVNWNPNLLRDYRPFEVMSAILQETEIEINITPPNKPTTGFRSFSKYPLQRLRTNPENLPAGVDVLQKEMHLTYDDFIAVFKMEPMDFEKLPSWRRQRLKQAAGLF